MGSAAQPTQLQSLSGYSWAQWDAYSAAQHAKKTIAHVL